MKTNKIIILALAFLLSVSFNSCVEDGDFTVPESIGNETEPNVTGTQVTFSSVKAKMAQSGGLGTYGADENVFIVGYVVSSDRTGNFFEELIIQNTPSDSDLENEVRMGLKVLIDVNDLGNKYNFGRKVYLKLAGLTVSEDSGVTAVGILNGNNEFSNIEGYEIDDFLLRSKEVAQITPKVTTIAALQEKDLNTIVKFENVQFSDNSFGLTFAGEETDEFNGERLLTSCNDGSSIVLSTSTFSDFKSEVLPSGSGAITAVYGKDFFGSTAILTLNQTEDINFTADRCDVSDNLTPNLTIKQLRDLYSGNNVAFAPGSNQVVEGYVVSSDIRGNFFKNIFIQDKPENPTAAIQILTDENNLFQAYPVGSKVVIKLDRLYLGNAFGDILSLGYADGDEVDRISRGDIGKFVINTGVIENIVPTPAQIGKVGDDFIVTIDKFFDDDNDPLTPEVKEFEDHDNDASTPEVPVQVQAPTGILVEMQNVQVDECELGEAYAFYSGTNSVNRTIVNCDTQNTMILRNSGFADFAGQQFPTGNGTIVGVVGKFRDDTQLVIRTTDDVNLTGDRCGAFFEEGFCNLNRWTTFSVSGDQKWEITTFGNPAPCVRMSGFDSGSNENEDWLISKAIDLSTYTKATLNFETIKRFSGTDIELFMATDYNGGNPNTDGTWVPLSATYDTNTGSWNSWTNSGDIDVSTAAGGNLFIAFKYTSTNSSSATFQIDNLKVLVE